jgi:hypothetical protein
MSAKALWIGGVVGVMRLPSAADHSRRDRAAPMASITQADNDTKSIN